MTGFLLDTNVVSAMRSPRRQPVEFQHWLSETDLANCHASSLTWMEIRVGVLKKLRTDPAQGRLLDAWLSVIEPEFRHRTIPFDAEIAAVTAPLWLLRSRGSIDTLIAGTALAHQLSLVTRNTSDFADIPHLKLINPWAD